MHHCYKYPRIKLAKKDDITQKLVKEYLDYDPITGKLFWKKKLTIKTVVGSQAGSLVKNRKYRTIKIFGFLYFEARLIWLHQTGEYLPKNIQLDHINHDTLDNRLCNLRKVSQLENNKNNSLRCDNKLGITGVYTKLLKNGEITYIAEINHKGFKKAKQSKDINVVLAWRNKLLNQFGFHPNHGKPQIKP